MDGPARPHDRYGRAPAGPGRRLAGRVALVALGLAFLALVVSIGLRFGNSSLQWEDVGYNVLDDSTVEAEFDVTMDAGDRALCTVEALNGQYGQVGVVDVEVGPIAGSPARYTATVRTTERAVTTVVRSCVLQE